MKGLMDFCKKHDLILLYIATVVTIVLVLDLAAR